MNENDARFWEDYINLLCIGNFFTKVICRKWHAGSKCSLVFLLIFDHLKCEKQWSNKGVFFLLSICLSKQENDRRSQLKKGEYSVFFCIRTKQTQIGDTLNHVQMNYHCFLCCIWNVFDPIKVFYALKWGPNLSIYVFFNFNLFSVLYINQPLRVSSIRH